MVARSPLYTLKRRVRVDQLNISLRVPWQTILLALLIPGYGFVRWWPRLARPAFCAAVLLLLVSLVWIGRGPSNFAVMGLVSLHVTSFLYVLEPYFVNQGLRYRIVFSILVMIGFWGLMYLPGRAFIEKNVLIPLVYHERIVVVGTAFDPDRLAVGDIVAFQMKESLRDFGNVIIHEALNAGPVLALPGDHVRFSPGVWYRNGRPAPALPRMPTTGEMQLRKKEWFIWGEVITRGGGANAGAVEQALASQACVSADRLKGKAFRRWFWWKQY